MGDWECYGADTHLGSGRRRTFRFTGDGHEHRSEGGVDHLVVSVEEEASDDGVTRTAAFYAELGRKTKVFERALRHGDRVDEHGERVPMQVRQATVNLVARSAALTPEERRASLTRVAAPRTSVSATYSRPKFQPVARCVLVPKASGNDPVLRCDQLFDALCAIQQSRRLPTPSYSTTSSAALEMVGRRPLNVSSVTIMHAPISMSVREDGSSEEEARDTEGGYCEDEEEDEEDVEEGHLSHLYVCLFTREKQCNWTRARRTPPRSKKNASFVIQPARRRRARDTHVMSDGDSAVSTQITEAARRLGVYDEAARDAGGGGGGGDYGTTFARSHGGDSVSTVLEQDQDMKHAAESIARHRRKIREDETVHSSRDMLDRITGDPPVAEGKPSDRSIVPNYFAMDVMSHASNCGFRFLSNGRSVPRHCRVVGDAVMALAVGPAPGSSHRSLSDIGRELLWVDSGPMMLQRMFQGGMLRYSTSARSCRLWGWPSAYCILSQAFSSIRLRRSCRRTIGEHLYVLE